MFDSCAGPACVYYFTASSYTHAFQLKWRFKTFYCSKPFVRFCTMTVFVGSKITSTVYIWSRKICIKNILKSKKIKENTDGSEKILHEISYTYQFSLPLPETLDTPLCTSFHLPCHIILTFFLCGNGMQCLHYVGLQYAELSFLYMKKLSLYSASWNSILNHGKDWNGKDWKELSWYAVHMRICITGIFKTCACDFCTKFQIWTGRSEFGCDCFLP